MSTWTVAGQSNKTTRKWNVKHGEPMYAVMLYFSAHVTPVKGRYPHCMIGVYPATDQESFEEALDTFVDEFRATRFEDLPAVSVTYSPTFPDWLAVKSDAIDRAREIFRDYGLARFCTCTSNYTDDVFKPHINCDTEDMRRGGVKDGDLFPIGALAVRYMGNYHSDKKKMVLSSDPGPFEDSKCILVHGRWEALDKA